MSFSTGEDVMKLIETLVTKLWEEHHSEPLPSPFPRLKYQEAMAKFGSDKPDTRMGMEISRLEHLLPVDLVRMISDLPQPIVEGFIIRISDSELDPVNSRKFISSFLDSTDSEQFVKNPDGAPGVFIYDSSKPLQGLQALGFEGAEEIERIFEPENSDILILQARPNADFSGGSTMLGNLRLAIHQSAVERRLLPAATGFSPLWVTDFPLFSPASDTEPGQSGSAGLASTHHPFTSPKTPEDVDLLATDPSKAIADHYDLVMNGVELGGGSRRIHNAAMQHYVMEKVLQMDRLKVAEFSHLLEALRAGCPPHAGIALGLDRLIAVMLGRKSIRDVIAFPKSNRGEDLLVRSPGKVTDETLSLYHLKARDN